MSRYNPDYPTAPIYKAAQEWRDTALEAEQSVLADGKKLWTLPLLDELAQQPFIKRVDDGEDNPISRLKVQLAEGSDSCRQLMAEIQWLLHLFSSNVSAKKKRKDVLEIWSWSGEELDPTPLLEDAVLGGIGSTGRGYNRHRWLEIILLINALRDFKARDASDRKQIASDPWAFSGWLSGIPREGTRQLIHILPHLLFPDTFERTSFEADKRLILTCFIDTSEKEIQKWSTVEIDRALLDLRQRLEKKHVREIDFYEEEFKVQWQAQKKAQAQRKAPPPIKTDATTPEGGAGSGNAPPKNLILYGPPGTGKTHSLKYDYLPDYQGKGEDRFEFVTFHQSYAYEDFVEGIRPITKDGAITYEVRSGVLKRLCDRARYAPDKQFALFIDEINRGNVAKVFGELITLIEVDKRIHTDASGIQLESCEGLKVTLPYSGERFGVPANIDVIGTMNTADRSIALLDSALRRRFQFEELMPKPKLLGSIDDGEGGSIDLQKLLRKMNERLSHLLHRDQTLGHSYFFHVKSFVKPFDELRRVFAREILPFLQEAFYDDWQQIRYVLADQAVEEKEIQLVRVQPQNAAKLFPKTVKAEINDGEAFETIDEDDITPDAIRKIYEPLE